MAKKETHIQRQVLMRKETFLKTMEKTFGNISQACMAMGIDYSTPFDWCKKDPDFEKQMRSPRFNEIYKDAIESKLAKVGIVDEHPSVLIFLAKTKMKDRGYVENVWQQVETNPIIQIEVQDKETEKELNDLLNGRDTFQDAEEV